MMCLLDVRNGFIIFVSFLIKYEAPVMWWVSWHAVFFEKGVCLCVRACVCTCVHLCFLLYHMEHFLCRQRLEGAVEQLKVKLQEVK